MDLLKDYFDGLLIRIRSPIFFSILLSFLIINWKAIFILFFSDLASLERLSYVESHTSEITALFAPLATGLLVSIGYPYLNWVCAEAISFAVRKHRTLQVVESVTVEREKLKKETELDSMRIERDRLKDQSRAAWERRLSEIDDLQKRSDDRENQRILKRRALDPDSGMTVDERANALRVGLNTIQLKIVSVSAKNALGVKEEDLLESLAAGPQIEDPSAEFSPARLRVELPFYLNELLEQGIIKVESGIIRPTALGYRIFDLTPAAFR